jgi:hypothetical protein
MEYLIYSSFSKSYYLEPYKGVTKDKDKAYRHSKKEIEKIQLKIKSEYITIIEI